MLYTKCVHILFGENVVKKNNHKCSCILKISLDKLHTIKIDHQHNHYPCQNEIYTTKIKMQIKTQAKTLKSKPA